MDLTQDSLSVLYPYLMVVCSVGDGTFLFSQMESTFWIAKRYNIPFLLIVLNNGGWNAPKVSALLVHKSGYTSQHNRKGECGVPSSRRILKIYDQISLTRKLLLSRCQHFLRAFSKLCRNSRCRRRYMGCSNQADRAGGRSPQRSGQCRPKWQICCGGDSVSC